MSQATEYAMLVARLLTATAVPKDERFTPANLKMAQETLADIKAYAGNGPLQTADYVKRVAVVTNWINGPYPEPWVAFTAGGPDRSPPAVALLAPQGEQPSLISSIWNVLYNYTGPGMLYQLLVEGKVPENGLTAAIKGAEMAVVENVAENVGTMVWVVAAVAAVALLRMRSRK